jgi:hypothetical protein
MDKHAFTLITHSAWGRMEVTIGDQVHHFKDCKVWPGGAAEWNWNKTGTQHEPGIQPADVEELLAQDVEVVVLARGVFSRLGVCPETETLLRTRGVTCYSEDTRGAVERYNALVTQGRRAGGLFHTTC